MGMFRNLAKSHPYVAAGAICLAGVLVLGWPSSRSKEKADQQGAGRSAAPGTLAAEKARPDTNVLPREILSEFGKMASIHKSIAAEVKTRESQWRSRLMNPPLAPASQACREMDQARRMISEVEKLPPLDEMSFAVQPPSRIWLPAERTAIGGSPQVLPPRPEMEVRIGPKGVIAAHSGEICLDEEDMELPSRGGLGFTFRRYYRSFCQYDGPMGYGWDHNHNLRLLADAPSLSAAKVLCLIGGEFETRFTREGEKWIVQRGAFHQIEAVADGTLILGDGQRSRWVFEPGAAPPAGHACWRLQRQETRHGRSGGNHLVYHYANGTDVLTSVEDPFGQIARLYYDGKGRLRVVSAPGRRIEFEYDQDGSLTSATVPQVATSLSRSVPSETRYRYRQAGGRPWFVSRRVNKSDHELFADTDLENHSTRFGRVMEAGYRVVTASKDRITWVFGRDYQDGQVLVSVTPPAPEPRIVYAFAERGSFPWLLGQMNIPSRKASWTYIYNPDGLCTREDCPDGYQVSRRYETDSPDPRARQNCLDENAVALADNPIGHLKAKGRMIEFLPGTTCPTRISDYQDDAEGVRTVLREERREYRDGTLDVLSSDVGGEQTWYFWNRQGQLLAQVDGCGSATLHYYLPGLPAANMESFTEGSADGEGVLASVVEDAPIDDLAGIVIPEDRNRVGLLPKRSAATPPVSEVTRFLYDRLGRKVGQIGPGYQASATVNRLGQTLAAWDTSSGLAVSEYDPKGRLEHLYRHFRTASLGASDGKYTGSDLKPFEGRFYMESYEYDAWSRMSAYSPTDEPAEDGSEKPVLRYERYPSGALRKLVDPSGTTRVHEYDLSKGLTTRIGLQGRDGEEITLQECLQYSPSGTLLSFRDDAGDLWTTRLDSLGREYEETAPDGVKTVVDLDGLDMPVRRIALSKGQIVDDHRWEYSPSGRLARSTRKRFRQADERKIVPAGQIVVEESRYDAAGHVVAQRGARTNAWRLAFYDGMGRLVAEKTAEADWSLVLYRNGNVGVRSTLMRQVDPNNLAALREVTIYTDRFKPSVAVPVDGTGVPCWARASIQQWSPQGLPSETMDLEGLQAKTVYDSRSNRVEETIRPARPEDMGEARQTTWQYDAASRQISQTTAVTPLALYKKAGSDKTVVPRRLPVPQTIKWHYDSLGRLVRLDQPDGLQVSRQYGLGGSMVTRMVWRHVNQQDKVLRDLVFRYGPHRRLKSLLRNGEEKPLQEFDHDVWGQCNASTDDSTPERVSVRREYDNLGLLWREQICYGHVILQDLDVEMNAEEGSRRLRWRQPDVMPQGFWTDASYHSDRDERVTLLSLDGKDFCQWSYQGQTPVLRTIPSTQARRTLSLDSMGEIVGLSVDMRDNGKWTALSRMRYALNARGDAVASAVQLGGSAGQPESVVTQYNEFDAYQQIIASAQEPVTCKDLVARCRELLTTADSPAAILAGRIHRDEAGNVFARYQGRRPDSVLGTAIERGTVYSPGPSIGAPSGEKEQTDAAPASRSLREADRLELASNRLVSAAAQGQEQRNYEYDLLGQLSEYPGTYWDGQQTRPVLWSLSFDSLGRLTKMTAVARDPAKNEVDGAAAAVADLQFAYDSWNRRVIKRVLDHATRRVHREATLYCDDRQTMALEQHGDGSWVPMQQYVWGVLPAEALQVVTSPYYAGTGASPQIVTYALHQDRSMDVVFATSLEGGHVQATSLATYLNTGESSSQAQIAGIRSAAPADDQEACWNGRVDDGRQTKWISGQGEWSWVEIQLQQLRKVSGLTVWADDFPNDFEVYRLDASQRLPSDDEINAWRRQAREEQRLLSATHNGVFLSPSGLRRKLSVLECPYELVLNGAQTERLVILWQNGPQRDKHMSVTEFSVQALPQTVSSLGQNGCWLDRETGLYYQHHRYRLPAMNGKFVSPDPLGFLGGPDLYAYANNNPLRWQDPDGRFAHIIWGAGIGAAFGGSSYLIECWITGEEISWSKLAIRSATGAVTGAVAAATFGAGSSFLAAKGFSSVANAVLTGAVTGGTAGFTGGVLTTSAEAMVLDGRSMGDALSMSLAAGGRGALIGAVGGAVGGAAFSQFHSFGFTGGSAFRSFLAATGSGASGGAAGGAVAGAWQGYQQHGFSAEMLHYAASGALRGAAYGAAIGGAGWVGARASGMLRPMRDYPKELPNPRGLLVRTQPGERTYDGMPVQPSTARHHVDPLSLGGRDVRSNIEFVPLPQHRIPHPPVSVKDAPLGTVFY